MSNEHDGKMSFDDFDETISPRDETCDFDRIVDAPVSRRDFLGGTLVFGSFAMLESILPSGAAHAAANRFAFEQITANDLDAITLPDGNTYDAVLRWGDPLWSDVPEFDHETRGSAASQARAFGDNLDGMEVFSDGPHTLLAVNNEHTNIGIIWGNRPDGKPANDDDLKKGKMGHGVTVVEIAQSSGRWSIVKDSRYNRGITPASRHPRSAPPRWIVPNGWRQIRAPRSSTAH